MAARSSAAVFGDEPLSPYGIARDGIHTPLAVALNGTKPTTWVRPGRRCRMTRRQLAV